MKNRTFSHGKKRIRTLPWLVIIILSCIFSQQAYAAKADDPADTNTNELLTARETVSPGRWHGYVGTEINYGENIVNHSPRGELVLLYFLEYDRWAYIRNAGGGEIGAWLLQSDDHGLKLGASVQRHLSRPSVDGMDRRRDSGDGVVNAEWRTRSSFIHLSYNHDLGNASNGNSVTFIAAHNLYFNQTIFHRDFVLVPSIRLDWLNEKLVDYYYGVRPTEAAPGRPAYTGREAVKLGAQLTGFLRMSSNTALFAGCHAEHFGSGITDSPIVYRSNTLRSYFGVAKRF